MALISRPHTVTMQTITETPDPQTKVVPVPGYGTGRKVACQVTPEKGEAVFRDYGLELKNPHRLFCNPEDARYFHVGNTGTWKRPTIGDTLTFRVMTPPEAFVTGLPGDHASCIIEITEFG